MAALADEAHGPPDQRRHPAWWSNQQTPSIW
jgi:hypothetical protein